MMEFSKILLIIDYSVMLLLVVLIIIFPGSGLESVGVAWVAQLAISSGAYYWKAKCENRTKVPIMVLKTLPKNMRDSLDLTAIIQTIISND